MRRVLRLPAYRRLLAAYTLNELAWLVGELALSLLVYRRTGSALGATAFFLCTQLVPALLSPIVSSRLDHRSAGLLPGLYGLQAVAFAALWWLAGHFELVALLAIVVAGSVAAISSRSVIRSMTAVITSRAALLPEGNSVLSICFSVTFMAGPALGGVVVAAGGTRVVLVGIALVFALIALVLLKAGAVVQGAADPGTAKPGLRAALAHVRQQPGVRSILGLQATALVFFTISIPVEVVLATRSLHAGAGGYGALISAWGGGAIAGSLAYARWHRRPPRELIAFGALLLGAGFTTMALAPTVLVAVVGSAVAGIGNGVNAVAARTALQEQVHERWMAMMMSLNESMTALVPGVGILLGGAIAALTGPRAAFGVAAAGSFAVVVAAWRVLAPRGPSIGGSDTPPLAPEPTPRSAEPGSAEALRIALELREAGTA